MNPNRTRKTLFVVFVLICAQVAAQDGQYSQFYPLDVGNTWTYNYSSSGGTNYSYTLEVIGTEEKENGFTYQVLRKSSGELTFQRIDTTSNTVYQYTTNPTCADSMSEFVLYKLGESYGFYSTCDYWPVDGVYRSWNSDGSEWVFQSGEPFMQFESIDYGHPAWATKDHYLVEGLGLVLIYESYAAWEPDPTPTPSQSHRLISAIIAGESWVAIEGDVQPYSNNFVADFFPNPFNHSGKIYYSLETQDDVLITIFDLRGQRIFEYIAIVDPGDHYFNWNGRDKFGLLMESGIYLIKIQIGAEIYAQKISLLK